MTRSRALLLVCALALQPRAHRIPEPCPVPEGARRLVAIDLPRRWVRTYRVTGTPQLVAARLIRRGREGGWCLRGPSGIPGVVELERPGVRLLAVAQSDGANEVRLVVVIRREEDER